MKLSQEIKKYTGTLIVSNPIYVGGIEVIYEAYNDSKSPIDEEFTFWSIVLRGLYGVGEDTILNLVEKTSMPEFILACEKNLSKKDVVKHYRKMYKSYKSNKSGVKDYTAFLPSKEKMEDIMQNLPEDVKEIFKDFNFKEIFKSLKS